MSAHDPIPEPGELERDLTPDEVEEWLQETFAEFPGLYAGRSHHDATGFFADYAFDDACLALGHRRGDGEKDGDPDWDQHYADGDHIDSWDGDIICAGTRFGALCSKCETEDCEYLTVNTLGSIWNMKGVSAS